jgi:hypothetical protein
MGMIIKKICFVLTRLAQGTGAPKGQREPQQMRWNGGLTEPHFALSQPRFLVRIPDDWHNPETQCFWVIYTIVRAIQILLD